MHSHHISIERMGMEWYVLSWSELIVVHRHGNIDLLCMGKGELWTVRKAWPKKRWGWKGEV